MDTENVRPASQTSYRSGLTLRAAFTLRSVSRMTAYTATRYPLPKPCCG